MNFRHTIEEIRLLGFSRTTYRIWYELSKRLGLRDISTKITVATPSINMTLNDWKQSNIRPFIQGLSSDKKNYLALFNNEEKMQIVIEADKVLDGRIKCFSCWEADFGIPFNWHLNPIRGVTWPADVSSSTISKYESDCGDIKMPWEPNRFPHFYKICRAYMLTGDEKYAQFFVSQISSWSDANPVMKGVNWYNGQEAAIRILAWIYGLYIFKDSIHVDNSFFQLFLKQLYLHTIFIDNNIDYAKHAVTNNHLIGEALGVYIAGVLFPFMPDFIKLKNRSKKILFGKSCLNQFYSDGGYCQLSFSYQRLALSYYLWACITSKANNEEIPDNKINEIFKNSIDLYCGCINESDGSLPNWGANDGAMLAPLSQADYNDYRPLISALSYMVSQNTVFQSKGVNEELFWLFGDHALYAEQKPISPKTIFPITGIKTIRKRDDIVFFRCGTPKDRFGQADQNSVVIFFDGEEFALDGGSYMYNDKLEYHRYFMGSKSHNTITVDGKDQMLLYRRFKWLYPPKAFIIRDSEFSVAGEQSGYSRIHRGLIHRREIDYSGDILTVKDTLGKTDLSKTSTLHWHIKDIPYTITDIPYGVRFTFTTQKGADIIMEITSNIGFTSSIKIGQTDKKDIRGWVSRYYGEKRPCIDIRVETYSDEAITFNTTFSRER